MDHANPLVRFLRQYGPIAAGDNKYDELIRQAAQTYGVKPIEVGLARLEVLLANFRSPEPLSVILTGTAGDGKTFHCRRVFEELGGDPQAWSLGYKVLDVALAHGGMLRIVKDLSELTVDEKHALLPEIGLCLLGGRPNQYFLIAANDGQLLATFRAWAGEDRLKQALFRQLEKMLVDGLEAPDTPMLKVRMFNLSRSHQRDVLDQLLRAVVEHEGWSGCAGCPVAVRPGVEATCPILINRERLGERTRYHLAERLGELMLLAQANDQHMPIRQLLLLLVNVLLGTDGERGLLDCNEAQKIASQREWRRSNPYRNALGYNLEPNLRRQFLAFQAMEALGVGEETSQALDDLLVFGRWDDRERYDALVESDPYFGHVAWERAQAAYLGSDRQDPQIIHDFMRALQAQRQRLFFELPDAWAAQGLERWSLGVFMHAGHYLAFRAALATHQSMERWMGALLQGLNRTFTGMMVGPEDHLYLAYSGGDGRARVARFLAREELGVRRRGQNCYLAVEGAPGHANPRLLVRHPTGTLFGPGTSAPERAVLAHMELRFMHFEYLMRVASGELPASFAPQCYEEFHGFKLRIIEALDAFDHELGEVHHEVELIGLDIETDGRMRRSSIRVEAP